MTDDFNPDSIIQDGSFNATGDDIQGVADLTELTAIAADVVGLDHKQAREFTLAFLNEIQVQTARRNYVALHGFGSFRTKHLEARSGIDPHGLPYSIGERVTIEFNPFADFKKVLSDATGLPAIS